MIPEWLLRFLDHRIGDPRVIRLIRKWLRAGVLDDGEGHCHVRGSLGTRWHAALPVPSPSFPSGDHPARGVAVSAVHAELPRCRGPACRTRPRRVVLNSPALGRQVRSTFRSGASVETGAPDRPWHFDEMVVKIGGKRFWLWRAVDKAIAPLSAALGRRHHSAHVRVGRHHHDAGPRYDGKPPS